jgi:hypothetical protein
MLSSKLKQFSLSDMPVLGLFNYRKFLFQRLKVLIARIFQVVKPSCFTNVGSVRNFELFLEILQECKIIQTVHWS